MPYKAKSLQDLADFFHDLASKAQSRFHALHKVRPRGQNTLIAQTEMHTFWSARDIIQQTILPCPHCGKDIAAKTKAKETETAPDPFASAPLAPIDPTYKPRVD